MIGRSRPPRSRSPALRLLGAFAIGGGILAAAALACGTGDLSDLTRGSGEGGTLTADLCPLRALPPPPPESNTDGIPLPTLDFALDDLRIDTSPSNSAVPKPIGIDLDHTCCDVHEPPSCVAPPDAAPSACQPDGSDNNAGNILSNFSNFVPGLTPQFIHDKIHEGVFSLLLTVSNWNGKDDDPQVSVMARASTGLNRPDGAIATPAFDGNDVWDIDPTTLIGAPPAGTDCSKAALCVGQVAPKAYVKNGYLVAAFNQIPLAIVVAGAGSFALPFTGATIIAKLSKDTETGLYRLKGEIDGRLPADQLLAAANVLKDPSTGTVLCSSPPLFNVFRSGLCGAVDLARSPGDDRKAGVPCAALSESATFTATPAKLGVIRPVAQQGESCADVSTTCP